MQYILLFISVELCAASKYEVVGCLSRCSNIRVVELLEINYIYTYILYRSMKALQSYSIFNKSLTQE